MFFGKRFRGYQTDTLSGLEILVLKIIQNNDGVTGYEITQKINRKFKGLWRGSAGTIYPLLNKLAGNTFVEISEIMENNRLKKKYEITQRGLEEIKNVLDHNIEPSVHSLMDFIFTMINDVPRIKKNVETMFCSFPYHGSIIDAKIDEADLSLHNIKHIERYIESLTITRDKLARRIEHMKKQIDESSSILKRIKGDREKARVIEILDDDGDDYDKRMMSI